MDPFFHDNDVTAKYEPNGSGDGRIDASNGGGTAVGPAECIDEMRCGRRHPIRFQKPRPIGSDVVGLLLPMVPNSARAPFCAQLKLARRRLHTRRSAAPHSRGRAAVCLYRGDACMLQDSEHGLSMKTDARGCRADGRCARDSRTPALVFGSR